MSSIAPRQKVIQGQCVTVVPRCDAVVVAGRQICAPSEDCSFRAVRSVTDARLRCASAQTYSGPGRPPRLPSAQPLQVRAGQRE